jgi:GT2 family glycosyltransferase
VSSAKPALSVVIAAVNGYRYIAQCLDSLATQRHDHDEIIVVSRRTHRARGRSGRIQ